MAPLFFVHQASCGRCAHRLDRVPMPLLLRLIRLLFPESVYLACTACRRRWLYLGPIAWASTD